MVAILLIFFALLLIYTYIIYPSFLKNKATGKNLKFESYHLNNDELPHVSILIPVCNEEKVIARKLDSILNSDYPLNKIKIYIGLDACIDNTLSILKTSFSRPEIELIEFSERQGKPNVLNTLIANNVYNDDSILILTDANVFFKKDTIYQLVKYFKDSRIGLVDSNIIPEKITNTTEQAYWNYETTIKLNESLIYGIIPGPSGGCYAIRKSLYTPVPSNFLVDDFFIGFSILTKKYNSILNIDALCVEDVVTTWREEFRRKIRIASGNFQNLWYFKKYALNPLTDIGFVFISHKILRWKTPFYLLILYYLLLLECTLFSLIVTLFLPLIDLVLFTFGLEIKPLRRFSYFIVMNVAVLIGFINFCKGIKSNVWQPTSRK